MTIEKIGGPHGDTKELLENLQPLLEYYQVHAYFSGHDHVSEHLQMGNIEYFVAGICKLLFLQRNIFIKAFYRCWIND